MGKPPNIRAPAPELGASSCLQGSQRTRSHLAQSRSPGTHCWTSSPRHINTAPSQSFSDYHTSLSPFVPGRSLHASHGTRWLAPGTQHTRRVHRTPVLQRLTIFFGIKLRAHSMGISNEHTTPLYKLTSERGRGQRTHPRHTKTNLALPRPSRHGEVTLRSDLLGTAIQRWFKQLRRLQSLSAIKAQSTAPTAQTYIELWSSILCATGFTPNFRTWWQRHRTVGLDQFPDSLPEGLPTQEQITDSFYSFKQNFEVFQSWQLQHRGKLLRESTTRPKRLSTKNFVTYPGNKQLCFSERLKLNSPLMILTLGMAS